MEEARKVAVACFAAFLMIEEEEEEAWYDANTKRTRKQRSQWVCPLFAEEVVSMRHYVFNFDKNIQNYIKIS